jgi:hypothetical protein
MTEIEQELLDVHRQLAVTALAHHFLWHGLLHSLDELTLKSMTALLEDQRVIYEPGSINADALQAALADLHRVQDGDNQTPLPSLRLIRGSRK